jgi:hypothetical protein
MKAVKAFSMAVLLAATACGAVQSTDGGQVGPMGQPGPAGPVGPNGQPGANGQSGASLADIGLPGASFYPESIAAKSDGTLYIGSIGMGMVYASTPGSAVPTVFVGAAAGLKNVNGLMVDEKANLLYLCANDFFGGGAATVRTYGLSDGSAKQTYTFTGPVACNDLVQDGSGNVYMADSIGKVHRLPSGGTAFAVWSSDTKLAPATAMGFGADGIVWDGQSSLYVNNFEKGTLLRIPINADGSSGTVDQFTVTPALSAPDGMRLLNQNTLVVVENIPGSGRLTRLALNVAGKTAAGTVLSNRLDSPTSLVKVGMSYWVAEGQLDQLFGPMKPDLPFYVRRLPSFD